MKPELSHTWTIAKRELVGYFASPVAYVFLVVFLLMTGIFTFWLGQFFQVGQASAGEFLHVASLALSFSRPGGRHAALGGREAAGHDRAAAHDADIAFAGDRRKIPRVLVVSSVSRCS